MSIARLHYVTDSAGVIIEIEGPWDEFAVSNGCPHLVRARVIGTPLMSHIKGTEVRMVYDDLRKRLDTGAEAVITFPYRCDSASARRFMSMSIAGGDGAYSYTSICEREEPFAEPVPVDYRRCAAETPEGDRPLVRMCSWCKAFQFPDGDGVWRPLEEIFRHVPLDFVITHGICEGCFRGLSLG